MEARADPQLRVEAVQKTRLHDQCEADNHVTDNTSLEGDPINYNRYNKVVGLCLGGHHEYSGNHREGETEQASLKCMGKPQSVKIESQWVNGAVTEQKCDRRSGWRSN